MQSAQNKMMIADDRWQYINGGGRHGLLIEYCGPSEPVSQILGTGQKGMANSAGGAKFK